MKEVWKEIEGFPHYWISSEANFKTSSRFVKVGRTEKWVEGQTRKPHLNLAGYYQLKVRFEGKVSMLSRARVMAMHFLPKPLSDKIHVNHKNGIKTDDSLENIEWVSPSENRQHAYDTGLQKGQSGSRNPMAILTEKEVAEIKLQIGLGERNVAIAKDFGVSHKLISQIRRGATWQ